MPRLVFANAFQNILLAQGTNAALDCPLFNAENIGKNLGCDKRISFHVPENLKRERVQIDIYTDIRLLSFGIYTDRFFRCPNVFVRIFAISQNIVNALLEKTLNEIQSFRWPIVMLMSAKTKPAKFRNCRQKRLLQRIGEAQPLVEKSRMLAMQKGY